MKRPRLFWTTLITLLLISPAWACMWDRDTLAAEAKGIPDAVRVITGRFERNPPLYYEMRLQRVAAELQSHPERLDLYDDAGAACDRLGRGDEALAWMDRKREQLERRDAKDPPVIDHRYRYLANIGTFRAHRWLRDGADRARIGEMKAARDEIAKAIRLNPDAHFGREKYQRVAMEWIIRPPKPATNELLPNFLDLEPLSHAQHATQELDKAGYGDAMKGLTGLVVLGNAWESVDVFHALAVVLEYEGRSSVAYMARLRCQELIARGGRSLFPSEATKSDLAQTLTTSLVNGRNRAETEATYRRLRDEAERWHRDRTGYMLARLTKGRHPDTHPDFWKDYRDPGPPPLTTPNPIREMALTGVVILLALVLVALLVRVGSREIARSRARATASR